MRKTSTRLLLAAAVVGAGFTGYSAANFSSPAYAEAVKLAAPVQAPGFADIVEAVSPAVVSVRVKSNIEPVSDSPFGRGMDPFGGRGFEDLPRDHPFRKFFEGPRGQQRGERDERRSQRRGNARPVSQGSGFFISEDGFLVTNNHVVDGGTEYSVVMDDGTELDAKLIGKDPRTDLAVLKVEEEREFTYVEFGDDAEARVGDWVVAVGNPFGLGGTVTAGIVSARGRDIGAGPYDDFLQIDAAVNRGNSGGPTFNLEGQVVGINTAIFSPSGGNVGIAFAVPASVAKDVVADLMDDGNVQRGWLGVRIQPVTDEIAESLGIKSTDGAIVADAESDAPAAKAGIASGDIIVKVDGDAIKGPRELSRAIANFEPNTDVTVTVMRDGKEQDISVKLGELPTDVAAASPTENAQPEAQTTALDNFGITVTPAEDGNGVLVTDIEQGSVAADAGLQVGDVIATVNNEPVKDAEGIEAAIKQVEDVGRKSALVRIERDNTSRFVALPLEG